MAGSGTSKKNTEFGVIRGTTLLPADTFHLKRVECRLEVAGLDPGALDIRMVLNDFGGEGAALFSNKPLQPGTRARLILLQPREVAVSGQVVWMRECLSRKRAVNSMSHAFRIGFAFQPSNDEEAMQQRAFFEEVSKLFPGADPLAKPKAA